MRGLALAIVLLAVPAAQGQGPVKFNRDVRPILSDNCFSCHGPDSSRRKASLRLDTEDGLFGPRDNDPVVSKKDPAKSPLVTRILADDPHEMMPPPKSNKKLTAVQKETLRRWVQEGAPFENHWSFVKPTRPGLPTVKNPAWVKNPIDAFILAKLDALGLTPAPEADRRALIRRVSLDLIGLPPTPAEVEAFVADKAPDAYEKLVDRLLTSDHYGEHRGRYWLDAARYGDTHGLHFDNYREMWPYRDWVIRAFNRNQPFDQFTIEQLAGDLLPNRTPDQLVASGFHRCNITTNEGGSINEEVFVSYTRDRVETTSTVWLGLTAGCCQCHNHKFDPISQKEFYQLAAYFRNTTQGAMDGNIPNTPPIVAVPLKEDRTRFEMLRKRNEELRAKMQKQKDLRQKDYEEWIAKGPNETLTETFYDSWDGRRLQFALGDDGNKAAGFADLKTISVAIPKGIARIDGPIPGTKGFRFEGNGGLEVVRDGKSVFDNWLGEAISLSAWVFVPANNGKLTIASSVHSNGRGWRLTLDNRALGMTLSGAGEKKTAFSRNTGNVKLDGNKWTHIAVTYDGSKQAGGIAFYVNGKRVDAPRIASKEKLDAGVPIGIRQQLPPIRLGFEFPGGGLSDLGIFEHALNPEEVAIQAGWSALRRDLAKDTAKIDPKLLPMLATVFFNRHDEDYRHAVAELADVEEEIKDINRRSPVTHVMQDRPGVMPTAKVLYRGQYDQQREEVKAGVFGVLNPLPKDAPNNRLGLAQWIVSPDNPLTARVTVNRFWQEVFGVGLVKTAEDFGSQGENSSHPELLDWLAVEFREGGWDVKKLFKLIVTSNAYKQAAVTTAEKREKDAHNRYLSRGPRYRMDGEMIRDQALAASGLLVRKIGGASVKPYQPEGVWEAVGILGASNTRDYRKDIGEGLYRRSMYWFWKRMSPPPSLEIFNAPSRETCTVRRERTNTPLQALVTMNDPQFVEAARHLGQLALLSKEQSDDARLDSIALRLMARPFTEVERKIVRASLAEFTAFYKTNPQDAAKLIAVGDSRADASLDVPTLAAWTMLANQLMNLDEVLNK